MIRVWRSPDSAFGHFTRQVAPWREETVTALDVYTDAELERIAASGFNAVWVHGVLGHVARTSVFPELGEHAELHQKRLNALVERARRHGVEIFMYCQPGRALPSSDAFWRKHPEAAGQRESFSGDDGEEIEVLALCTSTDEVKRHLSEGAAELARRVPGLGGLIMITASEFPSHCWARRGRIVLADGTDAVAAMECPRCAKRKPEAVVAEVIQLIRDGVRSVSATWKIVAWNWSWSFYVQPPCAEIIEALPKDVILMADFERGGRKVVDGKEIVVDEYSLGFAGPSGQFQASLEVARRRGLQVMAKLQFGTTHELATVPNLPVLGNVFAKADAARRLGLAGFMGCWNFGNMITANTAAFNAFLSGTLPAGRDDALRAFAADYFLGCDPGLAAAAWLKFGEAMDYYPFSIPFLYAGPANFAFVLPLNPGPLTGKPVGRSWLMDERGDDMAAALTGADVDEVAASLERLSALWLEGLETLRQALRPCVCRHAREELDSAEVCWRSFRAAATFTKAYRLRRSWSGQAVPEFRALVADQLDNLLGVLPILRRDPRFGYHIEAHGYQYDADQVARKIEELQHAL